MISNSSIEVRTRKYDDRRADLDHLQGVLDNPDKTKLAKIYAKKAMDNILAQCEDHKLVELRQRLIKAASLGDEDAEWRISNEIRRHRNEREYDKPMW